MAYPSKSFLLRHKLISFTRDFDVKGIRRLSLSLPKLLLPAKETAGKHVLQTIHGIRLLIDPSIDNGVEASLFHTGTYEKGTLSLLKQFLKEGDTFLDVGANIGLMACFASKNVGKKGNVIAIEANPKTVEILQYNRELNACNNIEILPIGVADDTGKAFIYENWSVNRGGASLIKHEEQVGIEIQLERLDNLFASETPLRLVKIDVEGKEPEVIRGGMEWFKKQRPIFIIEVSDMRENNKGASPLETIKEIEKIGNYSFWKLKGTKERRGKLLRINEWNDLPSHDNVICIPN